MSNDSIPFPIEEICTNQNLIDEVINPEEVQQLLAAVSAGDSTTIRQQALLDVLETLRRRTPPIYPEMLNDRTMLRRAVVYRSLEKMYRAAMTTENGRFSRLAAHYEKKFDQETLSLTPTISDGVRGSAFSISIERR